MGEGGGGAGVRPPSPTVRCGEYRQGSIKLFWHIIQSNDFFTNCFIRIALDEIVCCRTCFAPVLTLFRPGRGWDLDRGF